MANKYFAWIENAGVKTLHVVEDIPEAAMTVEKLLTDGKKIEPAVKGVITTLVHDGEALAVAITAAGLQKGANWASDAAAVAAVEKFVKDFIAGLPTLESAAKVLFLDVAQGVAAANQPAALVAPVPAK